MPSDDADLLIWRALDPALNTFRSALAATLEQVRAAIEAQRAAARGDDGVCASLGHFAAGRVDADRFSALLSQRDSMDAQTLGQIERAFVTLGELAAEKEDLFLVEVESGACIGTSVDAALAQLGRAFGAARVFELARSGRFRAAEHASLLEAFPFARWNRAERNVAPPLVIYADGADLRAEELARFLDGTVKLALAVRGAAPFVPLARLITPNTYVVQTCDETGLDGLARFEGCGIAALVPKQAARFVHDPTAGPDPWDRISIQHLPEGPARVGGRSARQQAEELRQLQALATRPAVEPKATEAAAAPAGGETVAATADPAGQLAAWLLNQADLEDLA